jgi:O-antigen ligase
LPVVAGAPNIVEETASVRAKGAGDRGGGVLFHILVALVIGSPLPLGSVYPLSWWMIAGVTGMLLLAHGAMQLRRGATPMERLGPTWPWLFPFAVAIAWIAIQASSLTPEAWHHPLWQATGAALDTEVIGAISINPFDTVSAAIRLLSYGGIFWLAFRLCHARERAEMAFFALSFAAFAYACYGLIDHFTGAQMVLWFPKRYYLDSVTSTFVNRNNYATYAGLGLICATGMLIKQLSSSASGSVEPRDWLVKLLKLLSSWRGLLLPGWFALITALLLTDSRAGVLSSIAGLAALIAAVAASRTLRRGHVMAIGGAIILGAAIFIGYSGGPVAERIARTELENEGRPLVYEIARQQIAKRPWLGTGYGTFEEAFRLVQTEQVKGHWDKAHNTYLENALELGVPAALALMLSVLALFVRCIRGVFRRRRDAVYPAIGIGATTLVACHSMVDFGLQIPAITATFVFIMGIAAVQSWPRRHAA